MERIGRDSQETSERAAERLRALRESCHSLFDAERYSEAIPLAEQIVREQPEEAESHRLMGVAYSLGGDQKRGLQAFEVAVRLDPSNASVRFNIGVCHLEAGRLLKAAESYAEAIRLDEGYYPGWLGRARVLIRLGDCPGAREAAKVAARLRPQEKTPRLLLVLVELLDGDLTAAVKPLEDLCAYPGGPAIVFMGLQELVGEEQAVALARSTLAQRSVLAREAAVFLGRQHCMAEQPDGAIAFLLDARSLGANDATTMLWLAKAYTLRGRMDEAETAVRLATALEPQNPEAWAHYGLLHNRLGKRQEAVGAFRTMTRIAPSDGRAWYYLGNALVDSGQREEAIEAYREAVRLGPESSRASNNLGSTYAHLDCEDEARRCYEDAIRYNPTNGRAWGNLGLLLARQGDFEQAIRHLREALTLRPERVDLSIALLEAEAALERRNDAQSQG